jgi:hypothetical protein
MLDACGQGYFVEGEISGLCSGGASWPMIPTNIQAQLQH